MPALNTQSNVPQYSQDNTQPHRFRQEFHWKQSEPFFGDLGYSLPLPWPNVSTAGYLEGGNMNDSGGVEPRMPTNRMPSQKQLIHSDRPEWFATNNKIRTLGGLPEIDVTNPVYTYRRADATVNIY